MNKLLIAGIVTVVVLLMFFQWDRISVQIVLGTKFLITIGIFGAVLYFFFRWIAEKSIQRY
jgi:hypothetical protein